MTSSPRYPRSFPRIPALRGSGWFLPVVLLAALVSCSGDDDDNKIVGPGPNPTLPGDGTGFFVSASTGHDDSAGTKTAPFRTIRRAIQAAAPSGADVFVAQGAYVETTPSSGSLGMLPQVSLYGGFEASTWQRNPAQYVTEIRSTAVQPTISCVGADSFTIDGFTIRSPDQTQDDVSSMCVYVAGVSTGVVISNNILIAGKGANGVDGVTTVIGTGAGNGVAGVRNGLCPILGGTGGTSAAGWPGGKGGDGGAYDGYGGTSAAGSDGAYGGGGAGGVFGTDPEGRNGSPGRPGTNGAHGVAGGSIGAFTPSAYLPSDGTNGTAGSPGRGGGGGGGAAGNGFSCGASGGGGGGGGRGGGQGTAGGGGGGSFGIYILGQCEVSILDNRITTGGGGDGGDAGEGAAGGGGGPGLGGYDVNGLFASAGNGGGGGAGGTGGHGGPGGGGPSIAIVEGELDTTTRSSNVITLGSPGAGGTTVAAGRPNAPNGIAREYLKLD